MALGNVDPITVSTVWHSMQTICREMRHIIDRTAQNYLIGQLHDQSTGIWTARGETVAIPTGLPVQFLGTGFAVKDIVKKFEGNLAPGDVILTNDPYHGGNNCHLPDWGFFRPIFYKGEFLFMALARAHQQDTGGSFPGGYFNDGYDIHAEGLCIPPTKVYIEGQERSDVMELIWNNIRWPRGTKIDNYAMIGSLKVCEQRITALLDKYGKDTVLECVRQMMDRTERAVREEIKKIPDGTYSGEAATDDDGTELDVPVWVRADITVKGDEMTIDLSRSDKQRKGFVNSVYAATYGNVMAGVLVTLDPALADFHNEGTMRPIHVVAPEGLVVNCQYPCTVGASPVNIGVQAMEVVMMALAKAVPERAGAAWGRHRGDYVYGVDHRTGEKYVRTSFDYDGSAGAVWGYDGYSGVSCTASLGTVNRGNVEESELRLPWRILRWEFVPDFAGAGRWRGGPGLHWEAVNEGSDAGMNTGSSDGDEMLGHGALGGEPTPPCRTYLKRGEEMIRVKPHRRVQISHGDIVVKHSSGGAGVGNPWERDPQAVLDDVLDEFVSVEKAREVYRVAIDTVAWKVDYEGTKRLRQA